MGTANYSKYFCYFLTHTIITVNHRHIYFCTFVEKGNVFIYLIPFMFKALKYSVRMTLR